MSIRKLRQSGVFDRQRQQVAHSRTGHRHDGLVGVLAMVLLLVTLQACAVGGSFGQCARLLTRAHYFYDMASSSGGSYAAVAYASGPLSSRSKLAIYDTRTGEQIGMQEGEFDSVNWYGDSDMFALREADKRLHWNPRDGFMWVANDCQCDETPGPDGRAGRWFSQISTLQLITPHSVVSVTLPSKSHFLGLGWSPDASRVAYLDESGALVLVTITGEILRLAPRFDLPSRARLTWLSSTEILVGNRNQGLLRLDVDTGKAESFFVRGLIPDFVAVEKLRDAAISSSGQWLMIRADGEMPNVDILLVDMVCQAARADR